MKNFFMRRWTGSAFTTTRAALSRMRARRSFEAAAISAALRLRTIRRAGAIRTHASAPRCPRRGRLPTPAWKYGRGESTTWSLRSQGSTTIPIIEITESGCGYLDGPDEDRRPHSRRAPHPVVPRNARRTGSRDRRWSAGSRLSCLDPSRQLPMGGGLHRTIWIDLHRLPHQKRTIKDSGLWYGRVAASNRLNV